MTDSRLFSPLRIGQCQLQHRIVLAPLTRFRATDSHVQLPFVKDYYAQRASVPGTLLITEATFISPRASGYPNVPGIWNAEQIEAWKEVTKAVHEKGSYIFLQLWALGRAADPKALKELGGYEVVSSSPTPEKETSPVPHELSVEEIKGFVGDYAQAAKNSIEAGFDGVEIHGANGYLVDQFTQDVCNKRTDGYGGSIENRSRFGLEVAKAVVDAVGADRTGIRLSPFSSFQGMKMKDPIPQFSHLLKGLKQLNLAYVHVVESRISGNADTESTEKIDFVLDIWGKTSPVLVAGGFKPDSAKRAANEEYRDRDVAIVFGRYYISNPDLPFRLKNELELAQYNRDTFYKAKSMEGYTDYPFSKEFEQWSRL
jgi:NADPH2 dehydrogenase